MFLDKCVLGVGNLKLRKEVWAFSRPNLTRLYPTRTVLICYWFAVMSLNQWGGFRPGLHEPHTRSTSKWPISP